MSYGELLQASVSAPRLVVRRNFYNTIRGGSTGGALRMDPDRDESTYIKIVCAARTVSTSEVLFPAQFGPKGPL